MLWILINKLSNKIMMLTWGWKVNKLVDSITRKSGFESSHQMLSNIYLLSTAVKLRKRGRDWSNKVMLQRYAPTSAFSEELRP